MPAIQAVIAVSGEDQKGVVARFATFLAERGVNILDIRQQVVHGRFLMDMLVDLGELAIPLDALVTGLLEVGAEVGMTARMLLHEPRKPKRVAVLVSKEPHCLARLIEDQGRDGFGGRGRICCVLSNHPDLEPLAREAGLPFEHRSSRQKPAHMQWLLERLQHHAPDVVLLARYMQVLPPEIVEPFRERVINIHPSLLPHFPGAAPYRQAYESGVRVSGCTAHLVTEQLDEGPIILQDVFHIDVGHDSAEEIAARGKALEASVLSDAARMMLDEKLAVVDGKIVFRPGLSTLFDHGAGRESA